MKWTNAEFQKQPEQIRMATTVILICLIAVQMSLLWVLSVCEFNFHFPDPTRMSGTLCGVFVYAYLFALFFGSTVAFWRFHWLIGLVQILVPILLFLWQSGFVYMFIHGPP